MWETDGRRETKTDCYESKVGDRSRGLPQRSLFNSYYNRGIGEGATLFPGLLHFTLEMHPIMLSVKQGGIKYHFLSLWYDSTWDWTLVSRAIGKHSTTILTKNVFFSWPYHTVLSSRPQLALLLLLGGAAVGCYPSEALSMTASWVWLKTHTDSNWLQLSCEHLHILFYNAHDLWSTMWLPPLIYTGASCSEKSLKG